MLQQKLIRCRKRRWMIPQQTIRLLMLIPRCRPHQAAVARASEAGLGSSQHPGFPPLSTKEPENRCFIVLSKDNGMPWGDWENSESCTAVSAGSERNTNPSSARSTAECGSPIQCASPLSSPALLPWLLTDWDWLSFQKDYSITAFSHVLEFWVSARCMINKGFPH